MKVIHVNGQPLVMCCRHGTGRRCIFDSAQACAGMFYIHVLTCVVLKLGIMVARTCVCPNIRQTCLRVHFKCLKKGFNFHLLLSNKTLNKILIHYLSLCVILLSNKALFTYNRPLKWLFLGGAKALF